MAATCSCSDNDKNGTYIVWCDKCKGLKMLIPQSATFTIKRVK